MSAACEHCGRGPLTTGDAVYRSTPKGQDPHWRCQYHLKDQPSAEVAELVAIIESAKESKQ